MSTRYELVVERMAELERNATPGPCNWAQPPFWPCDEQTLRTHTFGEACEEFVDAALSLRPWGRYDEDMGQPEGSL